MVSRGGERAYYLLSANEAFSRGEECGGVLKNSNKSIGLMGYISTPLGQFLAYNCCTSHLLYIAK